MNRPRSLPSLPVLGQPAASASAASAAAADRAPPTLTRRRPDPLGVLSIHLDGARCRVGCEFCYLGDRVANTNGGPAGKDELDLPLVEDILARLDYAEVAVAVSEPARAAVPALAAIVRAATARGRPVAVTTTLPVLAAAPELLAGVARVNLSVDPRKGAVSAALVRRAAQKARLVGAPEVVLIVSFTTPAFAEDLLASGLAELLAIPEVGRVALNALKPPPPWCDAAFWLSACARLGPLLAQHLDRRLFLDCYVAARILRLGGCPARPDLSPGNEFRSCVYQPAPDFVFTDADDLAARLADFRAPPACPFPIA